jgi:hypothetical protein
MKRSSILMGLLLTAMLLLACTLASAPTPAPDGAQPGEPATPIEATLPPLVPETIVPVTPSITTVPTNEVRVTATATATATPTPTPAAPTATRTPFSTGPLEFTVSIIGCQPDPAREGGVILKMRFDAKGGNGVYTYYRESQRVPRAFDRPATKGTAVIDSYRVESGDGQRVERKERFTGQQFGCP